MFTNLLISLPFIFCLRIPMTDPTTQKKSCFPASCRSSQHESGILYHLLPGSSSTRLISAGKIVKAIVVLLTVIFNNKNSKYRFYPDPGFLEPAVIAVSLPRHNLFWNCPHPLGGQTFCMLPAPNPNSFSAC